MITGGKSYDAYTTFEALFDKFSKQYKNISAFAIEDYVFITKPLSRKEYRDILNNEILSNTEKKDEICKACILYPPNFDLDECLAGIPDQLYENIMETSYLEPNDMANLIELYREEMNYADNLMTCIIAKAFPSYKLDELENMDMLEFCRLYSRAEWIINKMYDGCQVIDIVEAIRNPESINDSQVQQNTEQQQSKTPPPRDENLEYDLPNTDLDDKPISHMTPEQIQAMDDFYKKYPMFDKSTDYAYTGNVPQEHKLPPALRPNWGRRK